VTAIGSLSRPWSRSHLRPPLSLSLYSPTQSASPRVSSLWRKEKEKKGQRKPISKEPLKGARGGDFFFFLLFSFQARVVYTFSGAAPFQLRAGKKKKRRGEDWGSQKKKGKKRTRLNLSLSLVSISLSEKMKSEREREREGRNSKRKNKKREDEKSRPGLAGRLAGCCTAICTINTAAKRQVPVYYRRTYGFVGQTLNDDDGLGDDFIRLHD
jgi:hypothetical protein